MTTLESIFGQVSSKTFSIGTLAFDNKVVVTILTAIVLAVMANLIYAWHLARRAYLSQEPDIIQDGEHYAFVFSTDYNLLMGRAGTFGDQPQMNADAPIWWDQMDTSKAIWRGMTKIRKILTYGKYTARKGFLVTIPIPDEILSYVNHCASVFPIVVDGRSLENYGIKHRAICWVLVPEEDQNTNADFYQQGEVALVASGDGRNIQLRHLEYREIESAGQEIAWTTDGNNKHFQKRFLGKVVWPITRPPQQSISQHSAAV